MSGRCIDEEALWEFTSKNTVAPANTAPAENQARDRRRFITTLRSTVVVVLAATGTIHLPYLE